ncbi:hypothetical protein D3C73_1533270 [compost metagenome]
MKLPNIIVYPNPEILHGVDAVHHRFVSAVQRVGRQDDRHLQTTDKPDAGPGQKLQSSGQEQRQLDDRCRFRPPHAFFGGKPRNELQEENPG